MLILENKNSKFYNEEIYTITKSILEEKIWSDFIKVFNFNKNIKDFDIEVQANGKIVIYNNYVGETLTFNSLYEFRDWKNVLTFYEYEYFSEWTKNFLEDNGEVYK